MPSANRADTLLVNTDVMIPKPIVNTPKTLVTLGATIIDQLLFTLRSRSRAMSRRSQSFDRPPSRKVVNADHHHGVPLEMGTIKGIEDVRRNGDPLRLQEPLAADADGVPFALDRDAVTDLVMRIVGRR